MIREFLQNEFILEILLKYNEVYRFTFTPDFPGPLVHASFTYNAVLTHPIAVISKTLYHWLGLYSAAQWPQYLKQPNKPVYRALGNPTRGQGH